MALENIRRFRSRTELMRENFQNTIENMIRGSSIAEANTMVFEWDDLEPLSLTIYVPHSNGVMEDVPPIQGEIIAQFIYDFIDEDPQFHYTLARYGGNKLTFKKRNE